MSATNSVLLPGAAPIGRARFPPGIIENVGIHTYFTEEQKNE